MYSIVLMAALTAGTNAPACHGCCGYASGCCGCWGYGGYGCYGCYGCGGCWGGWGCYGCGGCYGCYGSYGGCYGCYGCYGGCYGCGGCYGASYDVPAYAAPMGAPAGGAPAGAGPESGPAPRPKNTDKGTTGGQARLIIDVPEDAKLYIDDHLMKTTAAKRSFRTPQLENGQAFYYVVRAEVVRDGKVKSETKRVVVRAGDEIRTAFPTLDAIATAKK